MLTGDKDDSRYAGRPMKRMLILAHLLVTGATAAADAMEAQDSKAEEMSDQTFMVPY